MTDTPTKYHSLAIILHWIMALAILGMLASGLIMEYAPIERSLKFTLFQVHKSVGVLLLVAFFLRLGVRLLTHSPTLPEALKPLEAKLAKLGHFALYALMFLMPFSGWLLVSTSSSGFPTMVFNWFEWPHIPGVAGNHDLHELAEGAHFVLAIALMAVLVAHIGAVFKHAHEGIHLIKRMWWTS